MGLACPYGLQSGLQVPMCVHFLHFISFLLPTCLPCGFLSPPGDPEENASHNGLTMSHNWVRPSHHNKALISIGMRTLGSSCLSNQTLRETQGEIITRGKNWNWIKHLSLFRRKTMPLTAIQSSVMLHKVNPLLLTTSTCVWSIKQFASKLFS